MEEWRRRMMTPQQGVRGLARSSQGSMCVMFELLVTFPAHPAFAGASRHTNNTDELSGFIIFVFTNFSQIKGCALRCPCLYFAVANHVSKLHRGITHPCSNVRPANLAQRSLQTVENRVRQSLKHVFGHDGNLGNSCADNAVALGAFGYVSWHHLEEKDGLFHVPTRMQSWTFLLPSVKLKILLHVGENVVWFFSDRSQFHVRFAFARLSHGVSAL